MNGASARYHASSFVLKGKWLIVLLWFCSHGCATTPHQYGHYRYGQFHAGDIDSPKEVAFEYGKPLRAFDKFAWLTGVWSRMLALNSHVNNHEFTENTKAKLITYLEDNDLSDVLVRVNQYDPKGEWRRLRENDRISPGWRYSFGLITLAHYTLIPGRIFGGDEYNAFTNTLYINSDVSAVALHEAAYAKDVHARSFPGTYAFVNDMPLISLWRHAWGVNDVLGYSQATDDWRVEEETYRVVYPQMGVHSTVLAGTFMPLRSGIVLSVVGAAAGHVTGRVVLAQRTKQRSLGSDEPTFEVRSDPETQHVKRTDPTPTADKVQNTNYETESIDEGEDP